MEKIAQLTSSLAVASQIAEDEVAALAAQGFTTIINNRPDGEAPGQPSAAAIEEAAERAGLAYHFMPVISGRMTEDDVAAFGEALEAADGPVLAFCRSGTRCTVLWALSESRHPDADAIIAMAANAGYDIAGLQPALAERRRSQ